MALTFPVNSRRPTTPLSVNTRALSAQSGNAMSSCGVRLQQQQQQQHQHTAATPSKLQINGPINNRNTKPRWNNGGTQQNCTGLQPPSNSARFPGSPCSQCVRALAALAASKSPRSMAKTSTTASVDIRGPTMPSLPTYSTPPRPVPVWKMSVLAFVASNRPFRPFVKMPPLTS